MEYEFVGVPNDLKGRVIGKGGCVIKDIMKASGAIISTGKDKEWFTVNGDAAQRACAKRLILEKVVNCKEKDELSPVQTWCPLMVPGHRHQSEHSPLLVPEH